MAARLNKASLITAATTTQVLTGPGILRKIVVGETAAGAIKAYDATSGTSNQFVELKASIAEGTYHFDCRVDNGIRVVTAGASKITVIYSN